MTSTPNKILSNYAVSQISYNTINNTISTPDEPVITPEESVINSAVSPTIQASTKTSNTTNIDKTVRGLPILMYHFFYDENTNTKKLDSNYTEISAFEQQMKYLSDNNYYYPTWDEVYEFTQGRISLPPKSVVVTIDDGDVSFFDLAVPILKEYNIRATSFLITTFVDSNTILEYKSLILDFESHSNNMHRAGKNGKGIFLTMSHDDAYNDLIASEEKLGSHEVFCYPFGDYNNFTREMLVETGFRLAVTTNPGRTYPGMDPLLLPRVRVSKGESLNSFIGSVK